MYTDKDTWAKNPIVFFLGDHYTGIIILNSEKTGKSLLLFYPHFMSSQPYIQSIRFGEGLLNNHKIKTLYEQCEIWFWGPRRNLSIPGPYLLCIHYPSSFYNNILWSSHVALPSSGLLLLFSLSVIVAKIINKQFLLLLALSTCLQISGSHITFVSLSHFKSNPHRQRQLVWVRFSTP